MITSQRPTDEFELGDWSSVDGRLLPWSEDKTTTPYKSENLRYLQRQPTAKLPGRPRLDSTIRLREETALARARGHSAAFLLSVISSSGLFAAVLFGRVVLHAGGEARPELTSGVEAAPSQHTAPQPAAAPTELATPQPAPAPAERVVPPTVPAQEEHAVAPPSAASERPSSDTTAEPAAEASAGKALVAKEPAVKEPSVKEPVAKATTGRGSKTKEPVAKATTGKGSMAKEPAAKASTGKGSTTKEPVAKASTGKGSMTKEPAAKASTGKGSTTKEPATKASASKMAAVTTEPAKQAQHGSERASRKSADRADDLLALAPQREPQSPPVAAAPGSLRINSRPWSQVFIDGRLIGNTPQLNIRLPAGEHKVRLANPEFGMSKNLSVRVRAGETVTRVETLEE